MCFNFFRLVPVPSANTEEANLAPFGGHTSSSFTVRRRLSHLDCGLAPWNKKIYNFLSMSTMSPKEWAVIKQIRRETANLPLKPDIYFWSIYSFVILSYSSSVRVRFILTASSLYPVTTVPPFWCRTRRWSKAASRSCGCTERRRRSLKWAPWTSSSTGPMRKEVRLVRFSYRSCWF